MDRGALDHPLEGRRRHRFGAFDIGDQGREVIVDEFLQRAAQFGQIDLAGPHHFGRVRFIEQRQKQMFQRCKFVTAGVGQRQRRVDRLFERIRE